MQFSEKQLIELLAAYLDKKNDTEGFLHFLEVIGFELPEMDEDSGECPIEALIKK